MINEGVGAYNLLGNVLYVVPQPPVYVLINDT